MFNPLNVVIMKHIEENSKGEKVMKGKYLSPKADLTFKLVFAEHKDLMMSLLNALLPLAEDAPIVTLSTRHLRWCRNVMAARTA